MFSNTLGAVIRDMKKKNGFFDSKFEKPMYSSCGVRESANLYTYENTRVRANSKVAEIRIFE